MPNDENPFLTYLHAHPGSDAGALKQLFRLLAKRTHPDLGAENEADFVRLQEAYNEALEALIRRAEERNTQQKPGESAIPAHAAGEVWFPRTSRERVLHFLYRYKAHLPTMTLDSGPVPPACTRAFGNATEAAESYSEACRYALGLFDEQFHLNRTTIARYPEVATKYRPLIQGIASLFDYFVMPGRFNKRLVTSYLSEIKPVTDFDPEAPAAVRTNRSAAARSALFRMRRWLESELEAGPCRVI